MAVTLRLPDSEHRHRWADTGEEEIIGGVTITLQKCTLRGCDCRRAVRPDAPVPTRQERRAW